jgi:hypothetical protein
MKSLSTFNMVPAFFCFFLPFSLSVLFNKASVSSCMLCRWVVRCETFYRHMQKQTCSSFTGIGQ